jgi:3-dehydroquinate synthase
MGSTRPRHTVFDTGGHPVVAGDGALDALAEHLEELPARTTLLVVGDHNTLQHCLPELLAHVPRLRAVETIALEPGEFSKSLATCRHLWSHLLERACDRHTVLVALGGGVVTDITGFVAGAFKRGIRYINVPTSLMGMVDAAIGGKTGVDHDGVKNVVGLFHDPLGTYVHVPFLRTLGKRELLNGVAEMIKHGLVHDAGLWEELRTAPLHDLEALAPLVARAARAKCAVVKSDPREGGPRRALNFGHTIGHAMEAYSWEGPGRTLLHGEAVAMGMICAAWLSWRMDLLSREDLDAITALLHGLYPHQRIDATSAHRLLQLMRNDKKNAGEELRFTLLEGVGRARIDMPVTAAQVTQALDYYRLLGSPTPPQ